MTYDPYQQPPQPQPTHLYHQAPQPPPGYVYPSQPPVPPKPPGLRQPNWLAVGLVGGFAALVLVGGSIAAASSGNDPDNAPSDDASPAATAQEYDSVEELRDAVEAAGHDCDAFEVVEDPTGALERANCTSGTTLAIYADQAQANESVATVHALMEGLGGLSVHLVGPNWTVNCGDDETLCEELQVELGGDVDVHEAAEEDVQAEPEPAEPEMTVSQEQAVIAAESYLENVGGFSRTGLIEQLEFEQFSTEDAEFAVDYVDPDWMEQAVISAESYMENVGGFSRQELIDQLEFEGFTAEQAEHGADEVGL